RPRPLRPPAPHRNPHPIPHPIANPHPTKKTVLHYCRVVNVIRNKNIKKQPWSKVECFAFGGATVRFASLEASFHAANHTIPPPPSHEGYPHGPKDKNHSPFHGEKTPDD
ncbi:MAG: hypothetical protein SO068_10970, partial [Sodaliphilus sp.]|nr:hypothetical protein [Sodaliphilus sp.]